MSAPQPIEPPATLPAYGAGNNSIKYVAVPQQRVVARAPAAAAAVAAAPAPAKPTKGAAVVKSVISGDTIVLAGGSGNEKEVTLTGISAPRFGRSKNSPDEVR
jgi:hypothetical protein